MAPVPALLEAAQARSAELEKMQQEQKVDMASLEAEITAKRAERSIAAQDAVRELLKKKEVAMKESKSMVGALALIARALDKLQQAVDLGLKDWAALHSEKIKISSFARKRLEEDPKALDSLKASCSGAGLLLKEGSLEFSGDKALVPKLKAALDGLESCYQTWIEIDDEDTFSLLDSRDEIGSLAKKKLVDISREGTRLGISGPPKAADNVAELLKSLLAGKEDLDCPKNLVGAAHGKAKEVESESGAIIAVYPSGGHGGGGVIYIRGVEQCVELASIALREWLDEREGAISEFVDTAENSERWPALIVERFKNDTQMMGQKFGIRVKESSSAGQLELRGKPDKVAEACKELQMMLGFYKKEQDQADAEARAIAKSQEAAAAPEPEDDWGAAPTAEPVPGAW